MPNPLLYLGIARCDLTVWLAWLSFAQRSSGQGRNRTGRMAQPFHLVLASDSQAKSAPSARDVSRGMGFEHVRNSVCDFVSARSDAI